MSEMEASLTGLLLGIVVTLLVMGAILSNKTSSMTNPKSKSISHKELVEHGYGEYNNITGKFQLIKKDSI